MSEEILKTVFTGTGGYPVQLARACEVLTVGKEYEIESVQIGSSSSHLKLKGVEGSFNTVHFDIDFDILLKRFGMRGYKENYSM